MLFDIPDSVLADAMMGKSMASNIVQMTKRLSRMIVFEIMGIARLKNYDKMVFRDKKRHLSHTFSFVEQQGYHHQQYWEQRYAHSTVLDRSGEVD